MCIVILNKNSDPLELFSLEKTSKVTEPNY